MWQRLYPQGHPRLAGTMDNLAGALESLGEYDQAREYHEKALVMRQSLYPHGHNDVALSFNNLAVLLSTLGEYEQARDYHEQAAFAFRSGYRRLQV